MKKEYLAPGVYVEETSLLPKSVAAVETAIPAFIGFTQKVAFNGHNFHVSNKIQPLEINAWSEYEKIFGGPPPPASVEVILKRDNSVQDLRIYEGSFLYASVKLFFENGGSNCLVVSVGDYSAARGNQSMQMLLKGLSSLEKNDTPTLILVPDAALLTGDGAGAVHTAMLTQCSKLRNRFAILDMVDGYKKMHSPDNPVERFRDNLGMNSLSFGAAYYPWLITTSFHRIGPEIIKNGSYFRNGHRLKDLSDVFNAETLSQLNILDEFFTKKKLDFLPGFRTLKSPDKIEAFANSLYTYFNEFYNLKFDDVSDSVKNDASILHATHTASGSDFHRLLKRFYSLIKASNLQLASNNFTHDFHSLPLLLNTRTDKAEETMGQKSISVKLKSLALKIEKVIKRFHTELEELQSNMLEKLKQKDETLRNVIDALEKTNISVPPGGAIAGIYSRVDREKGVWKAPANISLAAVVNPAVVLNQREQDILNVDAIAGKSVNAICSFAGKGILVWGARTLAGNDNEWRYVPVRRLALMIEQSVLEATSQFVFEPNEAATWIKIKGMVENFMIALWRQGALQGIKPSEAFFVHLGLGQTMSAQDLQNGLMITEIGFAAVRPAEFILLRIVHKMRNN